MRTQNRDCKIRKYVTIKTMGNVEQIGHKARALLEQRQTLRKLSFNNLLRVKKLLFYNSISINDKDIDQYTELTRNMRKINSIETVTYLKLVNNGN